MSIKSNLALVFARQIKKRVYSWAYNPYKTQDNVFNYLIKNGRATVYGKEHQFEYIKSYKDFKKQVPIHDYEGLKPYIQQILDGKSDVLWRGKPKYFAKTAGTTSGAKYIPITKDSMPTHIKAARNALLFYIANTENAVALPMEEDLT